MICNYCNVLLCRFGDDIPGMEGLGTGKCMLRLKPLASVLCRDLNKFTSVLSFCRHHCHLPMGGLQSPGAAWAGPVWYHLSLPTSPCNPLRITDHLHALQTICLRIHLLSLCGTTEPLWTVTNTKKWKKRKKATQKNSFSFLTLDSFCDSAAHTHLLMFRICSF